MYNWTLIAIAVMVSYILRTLPFCLLKIRKVDEESYIFQFLNYAATAIIGCLIYVIAFSGKDIIQLASSVNTATLIKFFLLSFTFIVSLYFKKPVLAFGICIILYGINLYFFGV